MNFIETLLENGFKHFDYKSDGARLTGNILHFKGNPLYSLEEKTKYHIDGWWGRTVYCPDGILIKGKSACYISLNGICAILDGLMTQEDFKKIPVESSREFSFYLISLIHEGKIVYKTITGEVPSDEIINDFLKM